MVHSICDLKDCCVSLKIGYDNFENQYLKSNYWPQVFMNNYAITPDLAQTQEKTVYKVGVNAFLKDNMH